MRETTSRRHATVPASLLLGALVLALVTAERGAAALPAEQASLSVGDVLVTEGTGATTNAVFRVRLFAASSAPVTVSYATSNGGATTPADYAARAGALSFAPGETEKTVPVPVVSDALDEAHENFSFDLSGASGATLADAHAFATIADDDPEVTVSVGDASASEGDAATFTVSLSAASGKLITLEYASAGGSAAAGTDFAAAGGTFVFFPGERAKTVTVATLEDALVEGDETFSLSLLRPANVVLADAQGTGTIRDDDTASDPPGPPDPPDPPDPPGGDDPGPSEEPPNSAPDCSGVRPSTTRLWPPNHKFRLVFLSGASDPDDDGVLLAVTGVTQDEPVRDKARGHKAGPDAAWVAGSPHKVKLRAERSARGDGRVYRLAFTATDEQGAECTGTAPVGVPHDSRRRWVDSGAVFDSFGF
ncbi:MAG: Calx-beta domain-containing protein [Gaiellales bacterium]